MADITNIIELLRELPDIVTGITVTKYLTAAGIVVLLYDHLLTFEEEVDLIWGARWGWLKILFFFNRYTVPAYITVCCYVLSGFSTAGLSTQFCQDWIAGVTVLCALSLGVANIFVVQRVWALWSGSKTILITCSIALILTYTATFIAGGYAIHIGLPDVSYTPLLQSCVVSKRQPFYILTYAIPIAFETFLFILICVNALMRPRYAQNKLVQQLYIDGSIYFLGLTGLRVFNIIVISAAPLQYILLGAFFIWAMITATINRMLITISNNAGVAPASSHPTPHNGTSAHDVEAPETPLVEMSTMRKGPMSPATTDRTYAVSPTLYSKYGTPNPYAKVTVSPFQDETPLPPDTTPVTTPLYSGQYPGSQYAGFSPQPNSPMSTYSSSYQGRSPAGPSSFKGDFPGIGSSGRSPNQPLQVPSPYGNGPPYPSSNPSRSAPLNPQSRPQYAQQTTMRGPSNNPMLAPTNFIDMRVSLDRNRPLPAVPRGHRPKESTSDSQRTYI